MSPVRPTVTVVGRRLDPQHHRLRDFLTRSAQPFTWVEAGALVEDGVLAPQARLPLVIEQDGTVTSGATVERLVSAWQMDSGPKRGRYDLAIVGAGPAGLAAAVYAASDGLSTLVIEADLPGGQTSHTSLIENFFGFPEGIGGAQLARLGGRQAEKFGAELLVMQGVVGGRFEPNGPFHLEVEEHGWVEATTVIACPGMHWRRLEVEGVEDLLDRGVYYGAGRSEARECAGDPVAVVGAGNSAGQAVMSLADAGARVTMLVRGDSLRKSMSAYLVERIERHHLIDVRLGTQVQGVEEEDGHLAAVLIPGERLEARGLFLCLGGIPRTEWAPEKGVRLDRNGFIVTGPDLLEDGRRPPGWPLDRDPFPLETSVPGLFAAGDVRSGSTKRCGAAVGEGAMATALVHRRLAELATTSV
jgi:thioredoxin reductase (NADPH)